MSRTHSGQSPAARKTIAPITSDERPGRSRVAWRAVLWLAVFLVYVPSLSSGFIWDDDDYVTENPTLRTAEGLRRIWCEPGATPQYYPLVYTSFWVEYHLWHLWPPGYHLTNVALHATNALLVWISLEGLAVPGAWFAAAAFGLHPVNVESVSWVTERKNVMSALFELLALRFLLALWGLMAGGAAPVEARDRRRLYVLAFAFFVAALLSKSVACSLPAVVLLLVWWKRGRVSIRDVALLVPFFAAGALLAWNTASIETTHVGASGAAFTWTVAERFLIAGRALWTYAINLVWPMDLSFIYPRWPIRSELWRPWAVAIAAFTVPVAVAIKYRRMSGPLVAVLYFGGTLLPALGFFNLYPMRYSYAADHFQYAACVGLLALLAAWWLAAPAPGIPLRAPFLSPARIAIGPRRYVSLAVLGVLAVLTWQRQIAFADSLALWSDTLRKNPTSMLANLQLGRLATRRGDFVAAEHYLRDGLRYRTDDLETYEFETNLANALSGQGRLTEAAASFRAALARRPDYVEALNGLANVEAWLGRYDSAIDIYRRALAQQPQNAVIRINLGNALAAHGKLAEAESAYRTSLQDAPASVEAHLALARVLARRGRLADAEAEAAAAVRLEPTSESAARLLSRIRFDRQKAGRDGR